MEPVVHFNPIQKIPPSTYALEGLRLDDNQKKQSQDALIKRVQETLSACPQEVQDPIMILECLRLAERVRKDVLGQPTYVKKDGIFLKRTMIIGSTATYIILKSKDNLPKQTGGSKIGTCALRIPVNPNEKPTRVYQLVNRDDREFLDDQEITTQKYFGSLGICPQVYDTFDYVKEKNGTMKRCAFVEAFDADLYLFSNTSANRPFSLIPEQLFDIVQTLAEHLSVLHSLSRAHGDLSLENMGVCYDAATATLHKLFLHDFGMLLKVLQAKTHLPVGGIYYEPPEIFEGKEIDPVKREIYNLGICLSMLVEDETDYEPIWLNRLADMNTNIRDLNPPPQNQIPFSFIRHLSSLNHLSARTGQYYTPEQIDAIIAEQKAFQPIAEQAKRELPFQIDALEFYLRLFAIMLHPDPEERPTAAEIIAHCNAFLARLDAQDQYPPQPIW